MFEDFETLDIKTDGVNIHGRHGGDGPALIVWDANSHTGKVYGDILPIWCRYATHVNGGPISCGHYVQEEAPQETLRWLLEFFGQG